MDVNAMIDAVIAREGGFVDDPRDRGGATCFGITEAVARAAGYGGDLRVLPRTTAAAIYRARYWTAPGFDQVAARGPDLAATLFDAGVNMGTATAAGFLQRVLGAFGGGATAGAASPHEVRIGAATLAALDAFLKRRGAAGAVVLRTAVTALKGERYIALAEARPADAAFLYGWLSNRMG